MRVFVALVFLSAAASAAEPTVIDLWPGKPPGETREVGEEKITGEKGGRQLTNVTKLTITVYRPDKDRDTGAAVLIAPGGHYNFLAWDHEGEDAAAWLNSLGVTGVLLKYRVPRRPDESRDDPGFGPHQDAQRAMSLVRSKAKDWGIDPKRIGMLGFSAGGHLTASTATNFDKRAYEPIDDIDKESCRPDFAVLIYPAYLVDKGKKELNPEIRVDGKAPPMFFAHAGNDPIEVENSVVMYLALKKAKVSSELHLYSAGGHGFGLRKSNLPCSTWPQQCAAWLRQQGILER